MNRVMLNKKPDESNYAKVFHDVFISYSRQDKEFVLKLRDALITSHHTVWLDSRDIPYTADWQEEIDRNIVTANNVLCVLSPEFIKSKYCRHEVAYAIDKGKRLVPIEIRDINREELLGYQELAPLNKNRNYSGGLETCQGRSESGRVAVWQQKKKCDKRMSIYGNESDCSKRRSTCCRVCWTSNRRCSSSKKP